MKCQANCKINLGLDILRRREDGFHELETVMVPVVGLYDVVEVERIEAAEPTFENRGLMVDCPAEKNICLRAWQLMHDRYGVGGVHITLDKRVPFGAGLGGGSADGTVTLLAINELFDLQLDEATLISLAAELGSDTAFFVRNTPQFCTGRGERMEPIALDLSGLWLVLIKPDEGVSTREAYAGVKPALPAVSLRERIARPIVEWQGLIKNDFEPHIFAAHPSIAAAKAELQQAGALYASMSGSGSTVFGLFDDEKKAHLIDTPFIYKL